VTPGASAVSQRVVALDVARGALMAWIVIVIHGMFWLGLVERPLASLALFEMPLVFMIAGAAHYHSERRSSPSGYVRYLTRRSSRILIPYFAYALACAAIMLAQPPGEFDMAAFVSILTAWLNPVTAGAGHSALMLNWHLWFVPAFLAVAALLPAAGRTAAVARAPLWALAGGAALLVAVADRLDSTSIGAIQMTVFYAVWAVFGVALAAAPARYGTRDYAIVFALALAALALMTLLFPGRISLDMQAHKFPPDAAFFLFSAAWVSLILILSRHVPARFVQAAARSPLLMPFMRAGYSIYLWQGLGYSAALWLGERLEWAPIAIWPLAVALSVTLGWLASPLERIRVGR
jgi:peptidoglycan/LPS O-acetylase OafA/YrhL